MGRYGRRDFFCLVGITLALVVLCSFLMNFILMPLRKGEITMYSNETDEFREMKLSEEALKGIEILIKEINMSRWEVLAILMGSMDFDLSDFSLKKVQKDFQDSKDFYEEWKEEELKILKDSYETIWSDVVYFPIPLSKNKDAATISYEDSWAGERNYRNVKHLHEGTDIMTSNNERGYFPIVSMTDGVVEKIGWLEKGGYRIGIRSPHGGYFYYAHLYQYAQDFKEGDSIKAGQLIGFMGDTGYSKVEGTVGNFDVHLHLGIYLQTEHFEELSVNPYWILRYIENKRLVFEY